MYASSVYGRKLLESLKVSAEPRARYHHRNFYMAKYKK